MLTSPSGWVAVFQNEQEKDANQPGRKQPVVRWDDSGDALVVNEHIGVLEPARHRSDFLKLLEVDSPVVAALPGMGWRAVIPRDGGGPDVVADVLGWVVRADGFATPLVVDVELMSADRVDTTHGARLVPPAPPEHPHPVNPGPPVP
ncbi:hypothetical protein ACGFX4_36395 [Kitasatospora sp. NPDC048365]|uniref:hypothetical protein n=1 Tax=Kitasatospora sp. NPDC048365 TaxID=3364050 RepID=UPI003718C62D